MQVKLSKALDERFLKLPNALQEIVLADLETAAENRIEVMERVKT